MMTEKWRLSYLYQIKKLNEKCRVELDRGNNVGGSQYNWDLFFFQYSWQDMLVVQKLYTAPSEKNKIHRTFSVKFLQN